MTWCKLLCFSSLNWDRMSSGESGSFTRLVGRKRKGLWMCYSGHRAGFARIPTPSAGWPPAHHHPSLRSLRVHWATRAVQANPELEAGTMWPIFSDPIQPPDPFPTWRRKLILSKNQGGAPFQAPNLNSALNFLGMRFFKLKSYPLAWSTWINQMMSPDPSSSLCSNMNY